MKKNRKGIAFMAIARGKESTEGVGFKRFVGVAPCFVRGVNPTKAEMEEAFNATLESEPEYVSVQEVDENGAKVKYPSARISFLVNPDPEKVGFDAGLITVSMFIRKQFRFNKDRSKIQVIDKYGRTAWVTQDEMKTHAIPMYSNGPANIDADYRPAYVGEEALTNFLIAYLNIPSPMRYNKTEKKWYPSDNPQESECRLENPDKFFSNDFSELRECISYQPNNKVKILFGVRTTDDNKQYQAAFTDMFLRNSNNDYSKLDTAVQEKKEAGAYSTTEFVVGDFREYDVNATDFQNGNNANMPFAPADSTSDNPWGQVPN